MEHEKYMKMALELAEKAFSEGEVPVGALVVRNGEVIGKGYNLRESQNLATEHAEIIAIREASKNLNSWRLSDCTLYVTLEPCPMCAGAIWASRIDALVFGCRDPKSGAVESLYQITTDQRLNHRLKNVHGGILEKECASILKQFFKSLR